MLKLIFLFFLFYFSSSFISLSFSFASYDCVHKNYMGLESLLSSSIQKRKFIENSQLNFTKINNHNFQINCSLFKKDFLPYSCKLKKKNSHILNPLPLPKSYPAQGLYGNCYVAAPLANLEYSNMQDKSFLESFSLSHATCVANKKSYKEGGAPIASLLRMANKGELVAKSKEGISHEKIAMKIQEKKKRCEGHNSLRDEKIMELEEYFWKKIYKKLEKSPKKPLPYFSIEKIPYQGKEDLWRQIEDNLKTNRMILSSFPDHSTNIIGANKYSCDGTLGDKGLEIKTLVFLDPNGFIFEVPANDALSALIQTGDLYFLKMSKKKKNIEDVYKGPDEIIQAILTFNEEIINAYIDKYAEDINKEDRGLTPLLAAVDSSDEKILKLLLSRGANINKRADFSDVTPLMLATLNKDKKMVELLLSLGADASIKNSKGVDASQFKSSPAIKKILRDNDKNKNKVEGE